MIIGGRAVPCTLLEDAIRQILSFVLPNSMGGAPRNSVVLPLDLGETPFCLQASRFSSVTVFEIATLDAAFSIWISPLEDKHRYEPLRRLALIDRGTAGDRETAVLFEFKCGVQLWSFVQSSDEVLLPLAHEQDSSILELDNVHADNMLRELHEEGTSVTKKGMVLILDSHRQVSVAA